MLRGIRHLEYFMGNFDQKDHEFASSNILLCTCEQDNSEPEDKAVSWAEPYVLDLDLAAFRA